jgi:TonB family protein
MRTFYLRFLLIFLMGNLSMRAQKTTMFIPYQYALDIDTSVWAVPYLVPHPSDYANPMAIEILFKPTSQVIFLKIHAADSREDMSTYGKRMMLKTQGSNHLGNDFISKTQNGLLSELFLIKDRPTYVRGYKSFEKTYAVTFYYQPNGDTTLCNLVTEELAKTISTLHLVKPSAIDNAAGLPYDYSRGMALSRKNVYAQLQARMQLHTLHGKFYYRNLESYWSSMRPESMLADTARFDQMCLFPSKKDFSFQRAANELEMMGHLPLPKETALASFLNPAEAIHDPFRSEAAQEAIAYLGEILAQQIGTPIAVESNVTRVPHTNDICYLKGSSATKSYFIAAMRTSKGWSFYPTVVKQMEEGMSKVSIRRNFLGYDDFGKIDPTFVMHVPSSTNERTFAFGIVPTHRKVREKYVEGISKRFIVATNANCKAPVFLPTFKIDSYDVVYEMIPPVANNTKFMTHPFEGITTRNKENIQYSIHYADEQKLIDSRYNGYQKIGVDDPTRRSYITSLHVTDCNRNGKEEVWYALISNGNIVEIHGIENTPQGLKPLVLTDAFKSLIKLEKQVTLLLSLSTEKQDPFQRNPPMGTSGMGQGQGTGAGGGYHRGYYGGAVDVESVSMDLDYGDVAVPVEMAVMEDPQSNEPLSYAEVMPLYPGGKDQMMADLAAHITYPAEELAAEIEGTVYVQFVVEIDGSITNVRTMRGVNGGPNLSKVAESCVKKLKRFTPGYQNGKAVRITYTLPVKFKLN